MQTKYVFEYINTVINENERIQFTVVYMMELLNKR